MSLLVLGADGYLGWALLCKLALVVDEPIIAVDDLSKRRRVASVEADSVIPIMPFDERMDLLRATTGRSDLAGVTSDSVEVLLVGTGTAMTRPDVRLMAALRARGISAEYMDSRAAARTYTVLANEGRRVGAALLPV